MQSFNYRLNTIIISIMALILLFVGVYSGGLVEKVYLDTLSSRLSKEASVIAIFVETNEGLHTDKENRIQQLIQRIATIDDTRITIIGLDGQVLADTEADPKRMDNHGNRLEVIEALHSGDGQAVRFSNTLDTEMIYVAHVIKDGSDKPIGAVRLSLSLKKINDYVYHLWFSLTFGIVAALLLTIIVSLLVSRHITQPIAEITAVARKITQKKFESRVKINMVGEIGQLAQALNFMASSLESQMKEIKQNEEKLFGILNNMVSGVILIGESRRILLVNSAIEEFLGYSGSTLIGKLHIEAGLNFGLSQLIDRCFKTGEKIQDEIHIYYPKEKIVDANLAPYTTDHGEVKGVVTVLHDITAIRRLEKLRSEFVANVSHELKTPITSIKGFAETLLDGAMDDRDISKKFLGIIYNESERLHRLINDLLVLSKIEQKRLPLQMGHVDVMGLIREIAHNLQDKLAKKKLLFLIPDLGSIYVEADRDRLQQILINLVDNAISYTPENGKIEVQLHDLGENIELSVKDNGIGIPEADLERIFERFYRVDKGRSRNSGGTGLGLAIVKHLVESHHGRITVDSQDGKGSVFKLCLAKAQS